MIELRGLNLEQNKKYSFAIEKGYFDAWEDDPRKWKHTFAGAYLWKHPQRVKMMEILKSIIGHVPVWEDMDDEVLRDLVDELQESSLAASSIKTMCAELKAVLNTNARKVPSRDFAKILSVRSVASQAVYLTMAEIEKVLSYKVQSPLEHFVHHCFCVQMLTGARRVDAERLTISNCDMDTNMLSYVPQKTPGIIVNVPVDERRNLRMILADVPTRRCEPDVFNETVRKICRNLDISTECTITKAGKTVTKEKWAFTSSHTARRSFATNLFLAGVSLEDIAMMMGHGKNIETTKRYICAERTLSPSVMSYFQPQN